MIVVKIQMRKPAILSCRHGFHVFQEETEYSYPFYFYTGNEKCHAKNIVTGIKCVKQNNHHEKLFPRSAFLSLEGMDISFVVKEWL